VESLAQRFRETLVSGEPVVPGDRLLVAVSGGVDSMVLLHLLHAAAETLRLRLAVAHLNHQLRGRSSDADERLVRRTAERFQIPVTTAKADVRARAKREGISIEMAARRERHEFLRAAARRHRARKIVMAHHADDQVELFFIRLFRGAGSEGLSGMKRKSQFPGDASLELIRPLLEVSKAELREYARAHRIIFREDATNASLDIQRNRIRNELLPLLRSKYQPNLADAVLRTMALARDEAEWATAAAKEWLVGAVAGQGCPPFRSLPVALQRQCVRLQLRDLEIDADFDLVERLRLGPGRFTSAARIGRRDPIQLALAEESGIVCAQPVEAKKFTQTRSRAIVLDEPGSVRFGKVQFSWTMLDRSGRDLPSRTRNVEYFDADKVGGKITLRHWRPGDRFRPIGMATTTKLQDFFTNQKVPRARRHELVLGITEAQEVFWVEGIRIGDCFKLTDKTIRCLQWRWKRL
jgi:tRNA(Ile)-lysidine synthase